MCVPRRRWTSSLVGNRILGGWLLSHDLWRLRKEGPFGAGISRAHALVPGISCVLGNRLLLIKDVSIVIAVTMVTICRLATLVTLEPTNIDPGST